MQKSTRQPNGNRNGLTWWRRSHRWLGIGTALFLLLLSVTGIGINHSSDWQLDRRHVSWSWLLDAYGIEAPLPTASFADRQRRATQLGASLYFDTAIAPRDINRLTGMVSLQSLAVVATSDDVLLFTARGEFVQSMNLAATLPAGIERLGRTADNRPVIASGNRYFIGDSDVTGFTEWIAADAAAVHWSTPSKPPASLLTEVQQHYRGRGLSIERLLLDLHSGRVVGRAGKALLDLLAVALIALSLTGLYLWLRRGNRRNGNGANGRPSR